MKELRKIFFVLGLITLTFFGVGSALAEDNALNKININGSASMDVMPDMAYVHFTVCGRGKTAGEATAENAAKVAEIRRALLGYGILGEEVQTLNYRLCTSQQILDTNHKKIYNKKLSVSQISVRNATCDIELASDSLTNKLDAVH